MKMLLFLMHQFPRVPSSKPMRDIYGIFSTIFIMDTICHASQWQVF